MTARNQAFDMQRYRSYRGVIKPSHDFTIARTIAVFGNKLFDKGQQFALLLGGTNWWIG
jgi:hypothetical protein